MAATLDIKFTARAYGDTEATSAPLIRYFDWTKSANGLAISNPVARQYVVDPNATLTIFNGQRSTSIDNTTAFTVTLSPLASTRYRITKTAGTAPAFRTNRNLNLANEAVTISTVANGTITVSLGGGVVANDFAAVQAGDIVWIPGTTTGDSAGPFNAANEGAWTVLGIQSVSGQPARLLTLARLDSSLSTGAAEVITPSTATQLSAWSAAGIQPGDDVEFASSLWSQGIRKNFTVDAVAPDWFEIISTNPLPLDAGILPTATGLVFYTDVKRWVRVEVDQEAAVQFNGDSTQLNRAAPVAAGDPKQMGWSEKFGPTWSLAVINRTSTVMTINVLAAD